MTAPLLIVATLALSVLALTLPPHVFLLADLALLIYPVDWRVAGVNLDPTDLLFLAIAMSAVRHQRRGPNLDRPTIPYFGLWLAYGALLSIAYIHAPTTRRYLTDPIRVIYQLYRYCWKPVLYYPLVFLLLADRKKMQTALAVLIFSADIAALYGIIQGYTGMPTLGFFQTKNQLGGFLIIPLLLSEAGAVSAPSLPRKAFFTGSLVLMLRALAFTVSRGAFAASVLATGCLAVMLATARSTQRTILSLGGAGVLLAVVVFAVRPTVMERPNAQRLLAVLHPTAVPTLQWRLHERWPYFLRKVIDHPWLGTGTDSDRSLGWAANTTHNGFLARAVISGIPTAIALTTFLLLAVSNGIRTFSQRLDERARVLGAAIAAATLGVMCHNVVDATLTGPPTLSLFWCLLAWSPVLPSKSHKRSLQPSI